MSESIVAFDKQAIANDLGESVRQTVEGAERASGRGDWRPGVRRARAPGGAGSLSDRPLQPRDKARDPRGGRHPRRQLSAHADGC